MPRSRRIDQRNEDLPTLHIPPIQLLCDLPVNQPAFDGALDFQQFEFFKFQLKALPHRLEFRLGLVSLGLQLLLLQEGQTRVILNRIFSQSFNALLQLTLPPFQLVHFIQ